MNPFFVDYDPSYKDDLSNQIAYRSNLDDFIETEIITQAKEHRFLANFKVLFRKLDETKYRKMPSRIKCGPKAINVLRIDYGCVIMLYYLKLKLELGIISNCKQNIKKWTPCNLLFYEYLHKGDSTFITFSITDNKETRNKRHAFRLIVKTPYIRYVSLPFKLI